MIEYNNNYADIALKYGQDKLIRAEESTLDENSYPQKKQEYKELALRQGIDYVINQYNLDALLLPGDTDGMYIAARLGYPLSLFQRAFLHRMVLTVSQLKLPLA